MSSDVRDQPSAPSTTVAELLAFEVATRDLVGVALRSVEHLKMSLPQFRLLLALRENGRQTSSQCAQALGVVASTVTRLADRLDASGHLTRGSDPTNRSIVTLELTAKGRKLVDEVVTRRRTELARVLDRLDPAERAAAAAGLGSLHDRLGEENPAERYGTVPL